jgi:peptidoglycan/xylan/chitin deacetylase (PgdA/CDA1 family)
MSDFEPNHFYEYSAIVDRPPVRWPNGAKIAVWIVPNLEHFRLGNPQSKPDARNYSRRDYGNRVGIWRVMEVLAKHGMRATVAMNGEIATHYPRIIGEMTKLEWELMGHGTTTSILQSGMSEEAETAFIMDTRKAIEGCGQKMRGWLGPGLNETWSTLDILKRCGVDYVCDWINDDLPYRMKNGIYSIPYTIELNDMPLFNNPTISIADFERRICDSFDVLYAEGDKGGRVMCVALHPFLIGVPHRIGYLDRALAHIAKHEKVWLATGSEIIDAFRAQEAR